MKTCTKCNTEKELTCFSKVKKGLFGVGSICKHCRSSYDKNRWSKNINNIKEKDTLRNKVDPKKASEKSMRSAS